MEVYRIIRSDATRDDTPILQHYGILGMKWGVRRTPEQLGHHRVSAGTKAYGMSDRKQTDSGTGAKRIAYLKPDRDHFRGQKDQKYETTYRVRKDLEVPSRAELQGVISDVVNGVARKEISKELAQKFVSETSSGPNPLNVFKSWKYSRDLKKMSMSELMDTAMDNILTAPKLQKSVFDELKVRGYNAIVDEANVGSNDKGRKGVDPIIVFDSQESLATAKSKRVPSWTRNRAKTRYTNWQTTANLRSYNKRNQW